MSDITRGIAAMCKGDGDGSRGGGGRVHRVSEIAGAPPGNEFTSNPELLAGAFPWVFLLGPPRGATPGTLSVRNSQHLLRQFTCAAAHETRLVYWIANQAQRHRVIGDVAAMVKSSPDSLAAFGAAVKDPDFLRDVDRAVGGDADAERRVQRRLMKHVIPPTRRVMHGATERKQCLAQLYGVLYYVGKAAAYITVSLDDVHSLMSVRLGYPTTSNDAFPAVVAGAEYDAFLDAFRTGGKFTPAGYKSVEIDCCTQALTARVRANPVAAAQVFSESAHAVVGALLGVADTSVERVTPPRRRVVGIFGTPYGFYLVIETQGRGTLHYHLLFWGTYSPEVLERAAADPAWAAAMGAALESMFTSQLPDDVHMARNVARAENAARPANAAWVPPPRPAREPLPPAAAAFTVNGQLSAAYESRATTAAAHTCVHTHSATCHKPPVGDCSCRLCMPAPLTRSATAIATRVESGADGRVHVHADMLPPSREQGPHRHYTRNPLPEMGGKGGAVVWDLPRQRVELPAALRERRGGGAHAAAAVPQDALPPALSQFVANLPAPNAGASRERAALDARIRALPRESQAWLARVLPVQNGLVSCYNALLMVVTTCNQCSVPLGAAATAKAALFYLCKYVVKDGHKVAITATLFKMAQKYVTQYPSTAADAASEQRQLQYLMSRVCNRLIGAKEYSAQQAACIALGQKAQMTNFIFWRVFVSTAVDYIRAQTAAVGEGGARRPRRRNVAPRSFAALTDSSAAAGAADESSTTSVALSAAASEATDVAVAGKGDGDSSASEIDLAAAVARHAGDEASARAEHVHVTGEHEADGDAAVAGAPTYTDHNGDTHAIPQHEMFVLRGVELDFMNLYLYCAIVVVVKRADAAAAAAAGADGPGDDGECNGDAADDETAAADGGGGGTEPRPAASAAPRGDASTSRRGQLNGRFRFDPRHKLYWSHIQMLRGKLAVPLPVRSPPHMSPPPEGRTPVTAGRAWQARHADAAAFYLTLFKPYNFDSVRSPGGFPLTWTELARFCRELTLGPAQNLDAPAPTLMGRFILNVMTSMCHGLALPRGEAVALAVHRRRNATVWGAPRAEPDGTELPPGRRSERIAGGAGGDDGEVVDAAEAQQRAADAARAEALEVNEAIDALEELQAAALAGTAAARSATAIKEHLSNVALTHAMLVGGDPQRGSALPAADGSLGATVAATKPSRAAHDPLSATLPRADVHGVMAALAVEPEAVRGMRATAAAAAAAPGSAPPTAAATVVPVNDGVSVDGLNTSQAAALRTIVAAINAARDPARRDPAAAPPPSCYLIHGGPGTGKTVFSNRLHKVSESEVPFVLVATATTATAALLLRANTLNR